MSRISRSLRWIRGRLRPQRDAAEPAIPAAVPVHRSAIFAPPGHFYSPIPSVEDIDAFADSPASSLLLGVQLNEESQLALLEELARFYPSMPFTAEPSPGLRYRFENPSYSYGDGTLLHTMLRWLRPKRLIEVGSGFTSALSLDTNERFLEGTMACTFIEPYPELLMTLLRNHDRERVRIIPSRLQDVDLALFESLEARDVLFIDSTHVSKLNSDVNKLFFEILPRLAPGTFVHIHDVFADFEYPVHWLREGRSWNEQYVLRAFLQFNDRFRVRLFGNYIVNRHPDWFRTHMPLCLHNPGGAFWMERVG